MLPEPGRGPEQRRVSRATPRRVAALLLAIPLLSGSCVIGGGTTKGAPLPPPPGNVKVTMAEYRFDLASAVPRGRVVFDVANIGAIDHALTLIELPEDVPPLDVQLHSTERRGAATLARVPSRPPGGGSRFAVDLPPGRYGLVCFLADPDGVIHALKGMNAEFRVT